MSLVARVAILKLIMGVVKINTHSEQRISWRINGKHAFHTLTKTPTPAQNNRKGWTLATHGSKCRQYVYSLQHENLLMFSSTYIVFIDDYYFRNSQHTMHSSKPPYISLIET